EKQSCIVVKLSLCRNRYLYGKKVEGVAFVLFGVKIDDAKRSIPDSLTRIPIIDGDGEAVLKRNTLRSRFQNLTELVGHTLYASVTVMTESGSDMVVTEQSGIHIVTSPYQIYFTKTPKYFKPGMPYELTVYVTNPDGSPAANVPVVSEPIRSEGTTLSDGTAKLILNTPLHTQSLRITVRTNHGDLPRHLQATKSMTATAYQTQGGSGNYLHVAITSTEIKPGDNLPINFNVRGNANSLNQIKYFTYLILTKGKIFKVGRQPRGEGQNLVTMNLRITPDLIPSFRFVAYYQVGNNEIVADSVWVDVKDTCMGTLVVKGASSRDNRIQMPGAPMKIKLEGDPGARVGLVAVDKAVYVLNDKYKISQAKIWDTIEKSDFGCTAGSGQNNLGVFEDAGLALTTSTNLNTRQRSDAKCPQPRNRRRRSSVLLLDSKASKAAQFQDQNLRKCCEDGMHENPMGYTCEKRAKYIQEGDACKTAFLECCRYIKGIRDENQRESELFLARSDFEDEFFGEDNIISRSDFPESWLWLTEDLKEPPNSQGYWSSAVYINSLFSYCRIFTGMGKMVFLPREKDQKRGGTKGAEPEVSLTAFILVALLESRSVCNEHINILDSSINKATDYLLKKYEKLQRPYTTALTAYALAAAERLNDDRVLMAASTGRNRWEEHNAHTHNIEGTSYALLALLKMKKFAEAGPVVKWLIDQKYYGGTYGQTQATVMVFQALAEYEIQMPTHKDLNLDIAINLPEREVPLRYNINYGNALMARTAETKLNEDFTVSASGDGKATMTILTVYNAQLREEANVCNNFHLTVSVEKAQLNVKAAKGAKDTLRLKICTRYLGEVDSTMTIIDVSLLTGFLADAEDLRRLSEGVDRYISKFEIDNNMVQKGTVVIYLDKVSNSEIECLQFKIHKHFEVGFIQPGSVKVYSYYNLDEQCTKFYHPDKGTGLLNKICHGNICRCAEESCSLLNQQKKIDLQLRIQKACAPNVDYGIYI
ncbi:A.superbus venom factor 1, partial [Pseudonaja textilis]|uniref:A.superbus venom factor 1 n=1 Tax=Pseudonaja textilis TaxID=8673 RepID=UPI000EA8C10A